MSKNKKHLDFELNLVPFIDLLSVCICFLLITAVWLNVGSMNVKQAVGGQSAEETQKSALVWAEVSENGDVLLDVKQAQRLPAQFKKMKLAGIAGQLNADQLASALKQIKSFEPELRTALIQPKAQTQYETIIELMDQLKKSGLADLGISPL